MKKQIINSLIVVVLFTLFIIPIFNLSASPIYNTVLDRFDNVQEDVTGSSVAKTPQNLIIDIVQIALGFLGLIFVIFIIYAGFQWMTAGGNSDTVSKAKSRIINATIGLVIVLAAYSITYFIIKEVYFSTLR